MWSPDPSLSGPLAELSAAAPLVSRCWQPGRGGVYLCLYSAQSKLLLLLPSDKHSPFTVNTGPLHTGSAQQLLRTHESWVHFLLLEWIWTKSNDSNWSALGTIKIQADCTRNQKEQQLIVLWLRRKNGWRWWGCGSLVVSTTVLQSWGCGLEPRWHQEGHRA